MKLRKASRSFSAAFSVGRALAVTLATCVVVGCLSAPSEVSPARRRAERYAEMGYERYLEGRYVDAVQLYDEALLIYQGLDDTVRASEMVGNIASVLYEMGKYDAARDRAFAALEMKTELLDVRGIVDNLNRVGVIARETRETEEAKRYFMQALETARRSGYAAGEAAALNNLGTVAAIEGDPDNALALHEEALEMFRKAHAPAGVSSALANVGHAHLDKGQFAEGRRYFQRGLKIAKDKGFRPGIIKGLCGMAESYFKEGKRSEAISYYKRAVRADAAVERHDRVAIHLIAIGDIYNTIGETGNATGAYREAAEIAEGAGLKELAAEAQQKAADIPSSQ